MRQSRLRSIWGPAVVAIAAAVGACHRAPTEVAPLSGEFQLVVWNGLAMPVNLGALPPDTSVRLIQAGALVLNASSHTFSYWYVTRNSRGIVMDSEGHDGLFTQNGSSIDFQTGAAPTVHFTGQILSDTIVITNWNPAMKFLIAGS